MIDMQDDQRLQEGFDLLMTLGVQNIGADRIRGVGRGGALYPENPVTALCGACAKSKCAVTASGEVYPCVFARSFVVGNVLQQSMAEIIYGQVLTDTRVMLTQVFTRRSATPNNTSPDIAQLSVRARVMNCIPGCQPEDDTGCDPCRPSDCKPTLPLRTARQASMLSTRLQPLAECDPHQCDPYTCNPNCNPSDCDPICEPSFPPIPCIPQGNCEPEECNPSIPCTPGDIKCEPEECEPDVEGSVLKGKRRRKLLRVITANVPWCEPHDCDPNCEPGLCSPDIPPCDPNRLCIPDFMEPCQPVAPCNPDVCNPDACDPNKLPDE